MRLCRKISLMIYLVIDMKTIKTKKQLLAAIQNCCDGKHIKDDDKQSVFDTNTRLISSMLSVLPDNYSFPEWDCLIFDNSFEDFIIVSSLSDLKIRLALMFSLISEEAKRYKSVVNDEKNRRSQVEAFENQRNELKISRKEAIRKRSKIKNIIFWATLIIVVGVVIGTAICAIIQWVQMSNGNIAEPKWDMIALAGILDAAVGVIGFGIERVTDHMSSKEIQDIDKREEEMYKKISDNLFIQNNSDGASGYQDCTVINL